MAAVALVNLGTVFGTGEDIAWLVLFISVGIVIWFVVSLVFVVVVVFWTSTWVIVEMEFLLGLAFGVVLGGRGCLGLGGGRPPGECMAALCLVSLTGVRGGCWWAGGIVPAFCFFW